MQRNRFCNDCGNVNCICHVRDAKPVADMTCRHIEGGQRCASERSISTTLTGDDEWYCLKHHSQYAA